MADFLRRKRDEILRAWEKDVRQLPVAAPLSRPALYDHVPALLDGIAHVLDERPTPETLEAVIDAIPAIHTLERLSAGFVPDQVVGEYAALRSRAVELMKEEIDRPDPYDLDLFHRIMDRAMVTVVRHGARTRERLLESLQRIIDATLASGPELQPVLDAFVDIVADSTDAETVAVLVRDGDWLRMRAAHGLDRDLWDGFSLRIGEGFAGVVAARREPLLLRDASNDSLVVSRALRERGIRGLYGMPLVAGDEVVGVAHMGTSRADDFSHEDKLLFRSMATRAAVIIANARLAEEMKRALRQRDDVLAIVSHDLRNPLGTMRLATDLLLERAARADLPDADGVRQLEMIRRASEQMERLIGDLLDLAKVQSARMTVELDDHGADHIVREARDAHEALAAAAGVRLETDVAPGLRVRCDRQRVMQLLANLLDNAIKFSRRGDLIRIGVSIENRDVLFRVIDQGPGIHPEDLPQIFDPYWSMARRGKTGSGLGLAIAKGIVDAHGGRIWAESAPGAGATFAFTLPLAPRT